MLDEMSRAYYCVHLQHNESNLSQFSDPLGIVFVSNLSHEDYCCRLIHPCFLLVMAWTCPAQCSTHVMKIPPKVFSTLGCLILIVFTNLRSFRRNVHRIWWSLNCFPQLLKFSQKLLGHEVTNFFLKKSFAAQFTGGETIEDVSPLIAKMNACVWCTWSLPPWYFWAWSLVV